MRDLDSSWGDVRGVLFDLDGTLVETNIDFAEMRRAVLAAAARHGAGVEDLESLDALRIVGAAAARVRKTAVFRQEVEAVLQAIELRASAGARPMPGAGGLLGWLEQEGFRVGVVTRNSALAAADALRRAGLRCRVVVTRADVLRVKPDPLHLLVAAGRLGAAPAELVMVGDHPMDVFAGKAAAMRTVGFAPHESARARLLDANPDAVIGHLDELRRWISRPSS